MRVKPAVAMAFHLAILGKAVTGPTPWRAKCRLSFFRFVYCIGPDVLATFEQMAELALHPIRHLA